MEVLKKGSKGENVALLQKMLNKALGFELVCDGEFGEKTERAVVIFQKEHVDENGVFLKADGVVGQKTWNVLKQGFGRDAMEHKLGALVCSGVESMADGLDDKGKILNVTMRVKRSKRWISGLILHCTANKEGKESDAITVNTVDSWHRKQGWSGIGYHYFIDTRGNVYEGRDVDKAGAHCEGQNKNTIGIVYAGGYDKDLKNKDTRTPQQKKSMEILVAALCKVYGLKPGAVYGHYQFSNKACPCFKIDGMRSMLQKVLMMVCLMGLMVFGSCARKVIDTHTENDKQVEQMGSSNTVVTDSSVWSVGINSATHIANGIDEWWKAHIVRTTYVTDSLGNQNVTVEESIDLEGGKHGESEVQNNTDLHADGEEVHQEVVHDTVYVKVKEHAEVKQKEKLKDGSVPLWCKVGLVVILLGGAIALKSRLDSRG